MWLVVFHDIVYGFTVSSGAMFTPSSLNCTPTTPMLSHADTSMSTFWLTVIPSSWGAVMTTFGGIVSVVDAAPGPGEHSAPRQTRSLASCADRAAAVGLVGGSLDGSPSAP